MNLRHVRWIAGGTGAGKSTVARLLERRLGAVVYDGDRAERGWLPRVTRQEHPHMYAGLRLTKSERAALSPSEKFHGSASLHGETIGFVVEDLLAMPADRPILVDWFGIMPRYVAPLLSRPEHAVFLLPTKEFRERALRTRFADPDRARANWGSLDTSVALANRLGRDELWDAEIRRQAVEHGLPVIDVDGTRGPESIADELAANFQSS
jgi:hypothetical protein